MTADAKSNFEPKVKPVFNPDRGLRGNLVVTDHPDVVAIYRYVLSNPTQLSYRDAEPASHLQQVVMEYKGKHSYLSTSAIDFMVSTSAGPRLICEIDQFGNWNVFGGWSLNWQTPNSLAAARESFAAVHG